MMRRCDGGEDSEGDEEQSKGREPENPVRPDRESGEASEQPQPAREEGCLNRFADETLPAERRCRDTEELLAPRHY